MFLADKLIQCLFIGATCLWPNVKHAENVLALNFSLQEIIFHNIMFSCLVTLCSIYTKKEEMRVVFSYIDDSNPTNNIRVEY